MESRIPGWWVFISFPLRKHRQTIVSQNATIFKELVPFWTYHKLAQLYNTAGFFFEISDHVNVYRWNIADCRFLSRQCAVNWRNGNSLRLGSLSCPLGGLRWEASVGRVSGLPNGEPKQGLPWKKETYGVKHDTTSIKHFFVVRIHSSFLGIYIYIHDLLFGVPMWFMCLYIFTLKSS